jgi:serine phosphatase RsbU (regulator of sigma subunit)
MTMGIAMSVCASLWIMWCIHIGYPSAGTVQALYVALAAASIGGMWRKSTERLSRHVLLSAGLLLPFLFQMILGGTWPSAMVMLWSLPKLVAAVNLERGAVRYAYLAATGILLTGFAAWNPVLPGPELLSAIPGNSLLSFNLAMIMPGNFILADRMLAAQRELRQRVFSIQREANQRFVQTLEERNQDMQQSLDYAARIQMALWPDRDRVAGLFQEMHVHYRPKEAVGGDLMWHARVDDRSYFIVLDCTGHGVPGSLMSMLIHGLLNEVVHTGRNLSAAQVIKRTQQLLNDRLDRSRTGNTDGAEMAVLCFDHGKRQVSCAGMGCGIILQEGDRMVHLKSHSGNASLLNESRLSSISEYIVTVSEYTRLFLYTDGVADQFCANDQRKFTRARLEATLQEAHGMAAEAQMAHFENAFEAWRGETPLVDDILLVGVVPAQCWHSIADQALESDAA